MFQRAARWAWLTSLLGVLVLQSRCQPQTSVEEGPSEEVEALSRTEFTDRIENFFEYDALHAGESSQFLIHLTDLGDGTPVAQAQVNLSVRGASGMEVVRTTAQIGRVTGIYVANLAIPDPGVYRIEFEVENDRLREAMSLEGFEVQ